MMSARERYRDWWNQSWLPKNRKPLLGTIELIIQQIQTDDGFSGITVTDFGGAIPSHETWAEIVENVNQFYIHVSPKEVDNLNWDSLEPKQEKKALPSLPNPPKPQAGWVYVVQADKYFKIGISKEPKKRIKTLGTEMPTPLTTIRLFETEDMKKLEEALHNVFAFKRIKGEWFALDESDVEYIKGL